MGARERPDLKTAITPDQIGHFKNAHVSGGGNVAYSSSLPATGMTLRGEAPLWIGGRPRFAVEAGGEGRRSIRRTVFPTLDD